MTSDILCVNKYKIKTKIIEIVSYIREGLQKPPLDVGRGDAIAFYNYQSLPTDSSESEFVGYRDWRAIHAGMPVQNTNNAGEEGKWIATHWYHAPSQMVDPEKELRERMAYLMNKFKVVSQ